MENTSDPLTPLRILAGNPGPMTGPGTSTWLIDGDEPALVDAGVGDANHVRAIAVHLRGRKLARVLVTHGHDDHASGVEALRRQWPGLEAWKWILPHESGWQPLQGVATVRAGGIDLEVVHTPGHAPDHVCFFDRAAGNLFSGDMMLEGTTVMIPAGHGGDLADYLRSLGRLAALRPVRAFPGHGDAIDRPRELIAAYLFHRREREAQVIECLDAGVIEVDAIVARVYRDLPEAVVPAARMTIQAHLDKIRKERAQ